MKHEPRTPYRPGSEETCSDLPGHTRVNERFGKRVGFVISTLVKDSGGDAVGRNFTT